MDVKRLYNELFITSIGLNLLDSLLTAIVIFSVSFFFIYFYRMSFYIAIGLGVMFFIRSFLRKLRQNKILILESEYPDLRERLRTSFDYKDQTNTVINALHSEIISKMRSVDINTFMSTKNIALKVLFVCILLGSTLYMSSIGLDILDIHRAVTSNPVFRTTTDFISKIVDQSRTEVTDRPYLDKGRLVQTGYKDMNVSIDTYNTELDVSNIEDTEKKDFGGHYPEEIAGYAQETYTEQIPEEHKDVVKEYFKKING